MTGTQYRRLIARYVLHNFGSRGIQIYEEVPAGTSIIGKQRRVDLLIVQQTKQTAIAVECKYQDSVGTVNEKFHTLSTILPRCRCQGLLHTRALGLARAYCTCCRVPRKPHSASRNPTCVHNSGAKGMESIVVRGSLITSWP